MARLRTRSGVRRGTRLRVRLLRRTDNAGLGDNFVVFSGFAWAVIAGVTRRVPVWLAFLAAVMVIIPPPFFWPAMGVLVVVLFGLTSRTGLDAKSPRAREVSIG